MADGENRKQQTMAHQSDPVCHVLWKAYKKHNYVYHLHVAYVCSYAIMA